MSRYFCRDMIVQIILVVCAFLFTAVHAKSAGTPPVPAKNELIVLNWSEYMDQELKKEFEQKFNATVKEVYFETDEMRDELLVNTNATGYDVVICNGPPINTYVRQKWLAPLTEANVPNLKYIDKQWLDAFRFANGYAVPIAWGTTGIAYRKDKISEPVTSWMQMFKPKKELRGKIIMIKDSRDTIGMALKALGYSYNSADKKELGEAKKLLVAQKPFVKGYSYITVTEKSALVTGEAWMAMVYNGDALVVQEHEPNIAYVLPGEGGGLWADYLVVLKSSPRKELAQKFINFLVEPKNSARFAEFAYYATPNKAAEKFLPKEFLEDKAIYPSKQILEKSEFQEIISPRAAKIRNRIFSTVIR